MSVPVQDGEDGATAEAEEHVCDELQLSDGEEGDAEPGKAGENDPDFEVQIDMNKLAGEGVAHRVEIHKMWTDDFEEATKVSYNQFLKEIKHVFKKVGVAALAAWQHELTAIVCSPEA